MESEKQTPTKSATKDNDDKKKGRHRKKHTYNAIRTQIEFYFSDANLSKDRYMGQLLRNDSFIPIDEFLKFNKIKALTTSVEDIATALKKSSFLALSDDNLKVRRQNELVARANCEECTLYVESLPPKANHDWVRNVFSSYGKVAYVSLPKFKHSKKIKEFGFVEFEEETSVQKALKTFETFGGVLVYEAADAGKMASIKSYEQDKLAQMQTGAEAIVQDESGSATTVNVEVKPESESESNPELAQPAEQTVLPDEEDSVEPPSKRIKTETACDEDESQDGRHAQVEPNKNVDLAEQINEQKPEPVDDVSIAHEISEEAHGKKKCRQRKGCSTMQKELQLDDKVYELKIMTKKEWRRLRNKYLNLQRDEAIKLKRLFAQSEKHHQRGQSKSNASGVGSGRSGSGGVKSIKSSPRVNFYGAMPVDEEHTGAEGCNDEPEVTETSAAMSKHPLFSFEPGLIVGIKFREPCVDIKDFRAELRQYAYVKYVDLKEGDFEAFVRVDRPSSANALVKEYNSAEHSALILSGELEQQYWHKMLRDREDKLNKRVKTEKVRGRTKLIRKINSHIKFDDDDD
ncbi:la-related protein 7 [Anopheles cruzii]|uniref:la-related protein 7 n=1 Tax=Anopheles cruzii TaxID=68878 RepID=UPI0022EC608C|nr:la-related protein 7 [Anopheles cruzii]